MAELFIVGRLNGATQFPKSSLLCKWEIICGGGWRLLEGLTEGQTQVDDPQIGETSIWSHPIDIHFATKGLQGWPKFCFQVWHLDCYGRMELYGYGFIHVPTTPGHHKLQCVTWCPESTTKEELSRIFLGGSNLLKNSESVYTSLDRCRLQTTSMGTVSLEIDIVTRNFSKFGIEL